MFVAAVFDVVALLVTADPGLALIGPPDPAAVDASSYASGVSADGSVVVGEHSSAAGVFAYRARDGVFTDLGDLPGGLVFTQAGAASADGVVVSGTGYAANVVEPGDEDGVQVAWRHTVAGGFEILGDLTGNESVANATGMSQDGSVIVGGSFARIDGDFVPFWTNGPSAVALPVRAGATRGDARAVSGDGRVVLIADDSGGEGLSTGAFVTVDASGAVIAGPTGLGALSPSAVSADGSLAVGIVPNPDRPQEAVLAATVRLDAPTQLQLLGDLPGGVDYSEALAVSDDGAVIVGRSATGLGDSPETEEAFVWTADLGMVHLETLANELGIDTSALGEGGFLGQATGVSADGLVVVGNAVVVAGGVTRVSAFALTLPEGAYAPAGEGEGEAGAEGEGEPGGDGVGPVRPASGGCGCDATSTTADGTAAAGLSVALLAGVRSWSDRRRRARREGRSDDRGGCA